MFFSPSGEGPLFPVLWLSLCSCAEIYCHDAHLLSGDPAGHHELEKWFSRLLAADRRTFISLCQHAYCVCESVHVCLCSFKHRLCALLVVCFYCEFTWWYFETLIGSVYCNRHWGRLEGILDTIMLYRLSFKLISKVEMLWVFMLVSFICNICVKFIH